MTDVLIIDGVDVSGCDMTCDNGDCALYYAQLNSDKAELEYGFNCSDNPNCYYKQLKRKEQECERLKQWQEDAENILKEQLDNFDKTENRYKQALSKIKEIAESCIKQDVAKIRMKQILQKISEVKNEM